MTNGSELQKPLTVFGRGSGPHVAEERAEPHRRSKHRCHCEAQGVQICGLLFFSLLYPNFNARQKGQHMGTPNSKWML